MSKMKDHLQFQEDVKLEYQAKLMAVMYDLLNPEPRLSASDIDKMEKSYANNPNPNFTAFSKLSTTSVSNNNVNATERIGA